MNITPISGIPAYQWQKTAVFPDWKGYVDDTLAMNSMVSFITWHGQGTIYLRVGEGVERFFKRTRQRVKLFLFFLGKIIEVAVVRAESGFRRVDLLFDSVDAG